MIRVLTEELSKIAPSNKTTQNKEYKNKREVEKELNNRVETK
jgi:hypothetical protein